MFNLKGTTVTVRHTVNIYRRISERTRGAVLRKAFEMAGHSSSEHEIHWNTPTEGTHTVIVGEPDDWNSPA